MPGPLSIPGDMMSTFPNSLQKPERFDLYVRKFRAMCAMHGIQVGSHTDLPGFMQKLVEDRFFGMDFWKLVGKLSDREGGELSDDQMLAVVVEGVTGGDLTEDDGEAKRVVDNLRAMLAGVDVQGQGQNQVEPAPFPRLEAEPWQQGGGEMGIHVVETSLKLADSRAAFMAETMKEETEPKAARSELESPELDEDLLRRELTRLVEQYLESVKRSKKNPLPEGVISVGVVADASTRRSLEAPVYDGVDELTLTPTGKTRLVLEPDAPVIEGNLAPMRDSASMRLTLEDHDSPSRYGKVIMYLLLSLAIFEAGLALYQHREPFLHELTLLRQDFERKTGIGASADRTLPAAVLAGPSQQSAQLPPPNTSTAPAASVVAVPKQPASVGLPPATNTTPVPPDQVPANLISNADLAGTVQVSPEAMGAYLVASRVPAYPDGAKAEGVQGSVEMQVIIAKDGSVKRVHVIRGDSRLRVAAAEAVYRWRYRPYLVDDQPVEVATTITVDFDLDR
jgi:TonB family protein